MSDDQKNPESPAETAPEESVVRFPLPDDSHVLTFDLELAYLRGRIIRVGKLLDDIISPHNFPPVIENALAETVMIALLLSSMLKYDGIFILQAQGDGALVRLVSDVTSAGEARGTAGYNKESLAALLEKTPTPTLKDMIGNGYLAFTVDQGEYMERYQGIVELKETLLGSIHHYFAQSEQIGTGVKMAVRKDASGHWRGGAIMLQHTPDHSNIPQDIKPIAEHWNRAQILLETCTDEELLDEKLHDNTLLYRLFHEETVRVYSPHPVCKGCRCTEDKLKGVLRTLSDDDLAHAATDGKITMTCEFCNKDFLFRPEDVKG